MGSVGEWIYSVVGTIGAVLTVGVFVMIYRLHGRTPKDIGPGGRLTADALFNQGSDGASSSCGRAWVRRWCLCLQSSRPWADQSCSESW